MTLTAPADPIEGPVVIRLAGRATIAGAEVRRDVVPADDRMQAFAYHHLLPAQELMVDVTEARRNTAAATVNSALPVVLRPGGAATVDVRVPGLPPRADVRIELDEPPASVTLAEARVVAGGLSLVLKAAADVKPGFADNLIVEVATGPAGGGQTPARRAIVGWLPAIPIRIEAGSDPR
jgi:hypothetical protein